MSATDRKVPQFVRYRFAGLDFDAERGLERAGQLIPLPAQERRLLAELLSAEGKVITKEALVRAVWRGSAVSDESISSAVFRLRRVLNGAGAAKVVATVYSGGYRIATAVTRVPRPGDGVPEPAAATRPSAAVRECLQTARELAGRRSDQDLLSATMAARRAVQIDPRCVEAWVLLAQISMLRVNRGQVDAREIVLRRVRRALRHALAIAPDCSAALAHLGWITAVIDGRTRAGIALVDEAIAVDGTDWFPHMCRGWALHAAHRPDDGLVAFEAMMQRNPLSTFSTGTFGYALGCSGRIVEAYGVLNRAIRQMPTVDSLLSARSSVAAIAGDLDRALEDARNCAKLAPEVPNQLYALAYALAASGAVREARQLLERMVRARALLAPSWLAVVLAGLGEREAAADALLRAGREGCTWLSFVQYDPRLRGIKGAAVAARTSRALS